MMKIHSTLSFKRKASVKKTKGQALVETLVTLPLLMGIGLGILQFGLIWEAKLALNHAALMTARTGAVTEINIDRMQETLSKHLVALMAPDLDSNIGTPEQIYRATLNELRDGMRNPVIADNIAAIRIVNPTQEAFTDFGNIIPNNHLSDRANVPGAASQVTVQEANILRVQVAYGLPLIVPFVGNLIIDTYSFYFCGFQECDLAQIGNAGANYRWWLMLKEGLFPVQSVATVQMQSPATLTADNAGFFMDRARVLACSDAVTSGNCYL